MSFKIKRNIKFICLGAEIYGWASQSELEFGHGQQLNMTRANTFIFLSWFIMALSWFRDGKIQTPAEKGY